MAIAETRNEPIGVDIYNQTTTGGVSMTMTAIRSDANHVPCVIVPLTEKRFFEWHDDDRSVTLRNKSGSYGGGERSADSRGQKMCRKEIVLLPNDRGGRYRLKATARARPITATATERKATPCSR